MAEAATKLPVKKETETRHTPAIWRPFEGLRQQIDDLFEDFDPGAWLSPFRRSAFDVEPLWRRESALGSIPAVAIVEEDKAYVITAELPGMDEHNVEVKQSNGSLIIKGEKKEEKEEKEADYYLSERRYGSFERRFTLPEHVDADKIEARFKNGVLSVTLPKSAEAQKPEKKITIKSN